MSFSEVTVDTFAPLAPLQTAVLFLVFNRPDTTAQVFEAIRKAKPPRLYVAADGPRSDRAGEAEKVARVREMATAVDWPCEVKTLFREENLGCKKAVEQAVTWFFAEEEEGIILEDDCLPKNSFFYFAEQLLHYYSNDESVLLISGTNHLGKSIRNGESYFFGYGDIWGWAAWRRSWDLYDGDLKILNNKMALNNAKLFCKSSSWVFSSVFRGCQEVKQGRTSSWAYPWALSRLASNGLSVVPAVNLITNIGFGNDATHTTSISQYGKLRAYEIDFPLVHPSKKDVNLSYYRRRKYIETRDKIFRLLSMRWLLRRLKRTNSI